MRDYLKHPKTTAFILICFVFIGWSIHKPETQTNAREPASKPIHIEKISAQTSVSPALVETPSADELQRSEERKRKRAEYEAQRNDCKEYEKELLRRGQENFKKKLNSALRNDIDEWFFAGTNPPKDSVPVSQIDRFYHATVLSGGLNNSKTANYAVNIDLALKLIDEVIAYDPTNSAGYLLKARIYDSLNRIDDAQKTLDEADLKTNHFDTYMLTLKRKILDIVEDTADVLAAYEAENSLLRTSSRIISVIVKYKKIKLGQQIMQPAQDDSKLLAELEWSTWDYQNAKYALEEITPGLKLPDHMEIHPRKFKILAKQFPEFQAIEDESNSREKDNYTFECDYTKMEEMISLQKKALARAK